MMDSLDTGVTLENITLAVEATKPYVLSWPLTDEEEDGEAETTVLAVMRREGGILLALPAMFIPRHLVDAVNAEDSDGIFGPSFVTEVPASIIDGGVVSPTGTNVEVLIIDCKPEVLVHMREFGIQEDIVYNFDEESPFAFPIVDALLPKIAKWASRAHDMRAGFYTPEEAVEEDQAPRTPRPRRQPPGKATPLAAGAKPKRVTTASLAADMQGLMPTLPQISQQLSQISERQALLEQRIAVPGKASTLGLRQTLSGALTTLPPPVSELARSLRPPPGTQAKSNLGLLASSEVAKPKELLALETEKLAAETESGPNSDSVLAKAVLAQSQALTTLVAQIASAQNDPMAELTGSSASSSTRGAATRAKLQLELAQHRGTFFQSVLQSMSRRMAPTSNPCASAEELLNRGVSGVRYLERFGGYGRVRELGQLQYQVMMIFDFLMAETYMAAMDGVALLAVSLEQASLDGGRMELATLLCLQEDAPASIFVNRQLSSTSRARSFAPLADQRWVTCALAFLKEMEAIAAKRSEMNSGSKFPSEASQDSTGGNAAAKPKAKGQPKKKGRGKGAQDRQEETDA